MRLIKIILLLFALGTVQAQTGACCANILCFIEAALNCAGGLTYLGDGTTCEDNCTISGAGACCNSNPNLPNCVITDSSFCSGIPGSFRGVSSTCPAACLPVCGNGFLDAGEECDDGNTNPNDGCSATCTVENGWDCDNSQPTSCSELQGVCCDSVVLGPCSALAPTLAQCNVVQGTFVPGGICNGNVCPTCGDGILNQASDQCDDGNDSNFDDCLNDCTNATCGDGWLNKLGANPEECDDGNTNSNDGCSSTCQLEVNCVQSCSTIGLGAGECTTSLGICVLGVSGQCSAQAGCTRGCFTGGGCGLASCVGSFPVECPPVCGDGRLDPGEECDDGNPVAGDGCDNCVQECNGTCTPTCGNDITEDGEECDDGNIFDDDGCAMNCTVEPASTGACCSVFEDTYECRVIEQQSCTGQDAHYFGDSTSCIPARCSSCCADGTCVDATGQEECVAELEGIFQERPCVIVGPCPVPTPVLTPTPMPDPTPTPAPASTGACCHFIENDYGCEVIEQQSCTGQDAHYFGDSTSCIPNRCRSCCDDGVCTDAVDFEVCSDAGGISQQRPCAVVGPCPEPTPTPAPVPTPTPAGVTLVLRKDVVNDDGGGRDQSEFTLTATAQSGGAVTFFGNDTGSGVTDPNAPVSVPASWLLSETLFPGYEADQWICNGGSVSQGPGNGEATLNVSQGGTTITCTITNDDRPRGACCSNPDGRKRAGGGPSVNTCEDNVLESDCDGRWTEDGLCLHVGCCGDGVENGIEECDDGNVLDNDGCDAECICESVSGSLDITFAGKFCNASNRVRVEFDVTPNEAWAEVFQVSCGLTAVFEGCSPSLPSSGLTSCSCKTNPGETDIEISGTIRNTACLPTTVVVSDNTSISRLDCDNGFCDPIICVFFDTVCDAQCGPGPPPDCDDGVQCTLDTCNPTTDDCENTPIDGDCNGNFICNGIEFCNATTGCQPGTPINCDDGIDCTDDFCVEPSNCTDACVNARDTCIFGCGTDLVCQAVCKNTFRDCLIACTGGGTEHCSNEENDANCPDGEVCDFEHDCDSDCNRNNISDTRDIDDGTSDDTNMDGVPDECQGCSYTQGFWKNAEHSFALPGFTYSDLELEPNCTARAAELHQQCVDNSLGTQTECDEFLDFMTLDPNFCGNLPTFFEASYPTNGRDRRSDCAKLQRQLFAFLMNTFYGGINDIPPIIDLGTFVPNSLLEEIVHFLNTHPLLFNATTCFEEPLSSIDRAVLVALAGILDKYNTGELPGGVQHCDSEQECPYVTFSDEDSCSGNNIVQSESGVCTQHYFNLDPFYYKATCHGENEITMALSSRSNCGGNKDRLRKDEFQCFQIQQSPSVYVSVNCSGCPDPALAITTAVVPEEHVEPNTIEVNGGGDAEEPLLISILVFVVLAFVCVVILLGLFLYYRKNPVRTGTKVELTLGDHMRAQNHWVN